MVHSTMTAFGENELFAGIGNVKGASSSLLETIFKHAFPQDALSPDQKEKPDSDPTDVALSLVNQSGEKPEKIFKAATFNCAT